jgi:ribose transport system permease protein
LTSPANTASNPPASAPDAVSAPDSRRLWSAIGQFGIGAIFIAMLIVFSILKPDTFPTLDNAKAILQQAAILAVLGAGLTVVLVIKEFDLSFDANTALSGALAVEVMVNLHLSMAFGVLAGILTGALVGVANGTLVAYGRAPAFIGTLAVGALATGVQSMVSSESSIYGVPQSYLEIATSKILGISLYIWISIVIVLLISVLLRHTVYGRHAHAVGSNPVAAGAAGVRTREVRWMAFVILGALAGLAGVLITAQGGGSAASDSTNLLLPTYTAAFLGASAVGRGRFRSTATYFGVIFIGTLQTGLTMLQQPPWVASMITGGVLLVAVLITRRQ